MIVHPHEQLRVAHAENSIPSGYKRMWMQTWKVDSRFIAFTFRWLTFSFWAFTGFKFLFLSIKKHSLLIWSESALEARKFCKGQPEEDTSIIYLPLGEGMNQINYFPRATAGRLTPAIIKTIKYGGGRESISQSLTLVILASETIREQQIYSSAALSDCFPSCSSLPGSNSCPLCDTHSSAGHVVSWWQTQSCSNRLNISSFFALVEQPRMISSLQRESWMKMKAIHIEKSWVRDGWTKEAQQKLSMGEVLPLSPPPEDFIYLRWVLDFYCGQDLTADAATKNTVGNSWGC